jgi:S-disulfanyl-L-cysteine oxidoreductase SoxD
MTTRSLLTLCGTAVFFAILTPVAAQTRRTVWDGVFTAEQAARGQAIFTATCAGCHGADLTAANRPPLKGEAFLNHWMEDSLGSLLARVKSMPTNAATVTDSAYADLTAFLLDANGFPRGRQELNASAIPDIWVQGKNGPAPVPNFSLVDVVACFGREPAGAWILTNGSEPTRTRNPSKRTESEIAATRSKPLGGQTFQLLDVNYFSSSFRPEAHAGQKVAAKGFLIRTAADARINVTWIEVLAADCSR